MVTCFQKNAFLNWDVPWHLTSRTNRGLLLFVLVVSLLKCVFINTCMCVCFCGHSTGYERDLHLVRSSTSTSMASCSTWSSSLISSSCTSSSFRPGEDKHQNNVRKTLEQQHTIRTLTYTRRWIQSISQKYRGRCVLKVISDWAVICSGYSECSLRKRRNIAFIYNFNRAITRIFHDTDWIQPQQAFLPTKTILGFNMVFCWCVQHATKSRSKHHVHTA